jgi:hypothetical protein
MPHTGPQPDHLTLPRENDTGRRRFVTGYSITCPRCHQKTRQRTVHLAKMWLYAHRCDGVVD